MKDDKFHLELELTEESLREILNLQVQSGSGSHGVWFRINGQSTERGAVLAVRAVRDAVVNVLKTA